MPALPSGKMGCCFQVEKGSSQKEGEVMKQDPKAWQAGYDAGKEGKSPPTPRGLDGLSFQSGVIEGKAARNQVNQPFKRL